MKWKFCKITDICETEYQNIYNSLSDSRKERIDRLKQPKDRLRSLAATYVLNALLQECGQTKAMIENDEKGRPFLRNSDLYISISHSEDMVVCAVSETSVGIDVEKIKPIRPELVDYACNEQEKKFVIGDNTKSDNEIYRDFFAVWTAKEAFFKKNNGDIKNVCRIDTLSFEKQTFIIDDYIITVL